MESCIPFRSHNDKSTFILAVAGLEQLPHALSHTLNTIISIFIQNTLDFHMLITGEKITKIYKVPLLG